MRLLQYDHVGEVSFTKDLSEAELPNYRYAILSHTWGSDEEEVTYDDVVNGIGTSKPGTGSEKIRFCVEQTREDGLAYFWVDTCCIDKRNLVELSRALISMFRWYSKGEKCYTFLSDVAYSSPTSSEEKGSKRWEEAFRRSRWFIRGWTLQELLASRSLTFFSRDRYNLGTKASLGQVISEITHIPTEALHSRPISSFTVQERLSWQANRQTKEEEDIVYSLLGIFNVSMPVLYGEGQAQAWARLSALLEQPEIPPKPSSNVPYYRDPHFVERPALTDQIRTRLDVLAGRVALVGLGGVGKSQLAIEYARELRQRSPHTWVLWIHASSAARFEQSVREVADLLKIYGREDAKADILQLFRDRLCDSSQGRWLMVLDNADDAEFLLDSPAMRDGEHPSYRRIDYIPSCEHGSIVITSRSKSEAIKQLVYESDIIDVLPMDEVEAETLLESKLGQPSPDNGPLVRSLDCMPLAIAQAAAFIRERRPRCSARQYREQVEQSRETRTSLLQRQVSLPSRDAEASNSVMLTWQISFEHVYRTQRSAAELLSLMSFCDRLAIPESILRSGSADADSAANSSAFEDDLVILRSFSFVSETADPSKSEWEMHRLVQDATQVWLHHHGRFHDVLNTFINHLDTSFPAARFENWSLCRMLFPHAMNATEYRPVSADARIKWASVMYNAAWFALEQGVYDSALTMARCSQTARSEQLGEDDEATLWSIAMVASTYKNQGRWKEAERLFVKVMQTSKEKLGPDHPFTLTCMDNLASTYMNQGRWEEAKPLEMKVMETSREKLGPDHPSTLTSMANLASTYRNEGRWEEAERLFVKVMDTSREKLGLDHPSTLTSTSNLASTYMIQGRWEEAERLLVKVIETRREKLGPDHPSTLTSMNNLAVTYLNQERWAEAEHLQTRAVNGYKKSYGPQHPHTLRAIATLEDIRRDRADMFVHAALPVPGSPARAAFGPQGSRNHISYEERHAKPGP